MRDVRGFATKFYTHEGWVINECQMSRIFTPILSNWDLVGNNIPVCYYPIIPLRVSLTIALRSSSFKMQSNSRISFTLSSLSRIMRSLRARQLTTIFGTSSIFNLRVSQHEFCPLYAWSNCLPFSATHVGFTTASCTAANDEG